MRKSLVVGALFTGAVCPAVHAQSSAWLPAERQMVVTPSYTYQTFDKFWVGDTKVSLKPYDSSQHTATLGLEYGLFPEAALDASFGYTWAQSKAFNPAQVKQTDEGLNDTRFGLRWQVIDEKKAATWAPSVALRVGGIIEGTYDQNLPWSAGDGASGVETSVLFGKAIGGTGFGIYGDLGWRWRNHDVPEDIFGSIGVFQSISFVTLSVAYRHVQGLSGQDIGDPGFGTDFGFPQTKEISRNIEAGIGFRDNGGRYYQVYGARTLDGRNTGEKWVIGASVSLAFGGK